MLAKGHREYTSAEVKGLRGKKLTAKQVHDARMKLKWK